MRVPRDDHHRKEHDHGSYSTTDKPANPVDFKVAEPRELHYWRKHPDLHGWMKDLYYAKGGSDRDFNCVPVILASDDIDRLESDILSDSLPSTSGFFFGASDGTEHADDLAFVAKARAALSAGLTVYYDSWW